ncbi:MAG: ABC transporter permease, partial [Prevotella sp.]|nr:ABC transporter permease [Prevotella sp.]
FVQVFVKLEQYLDPGNLSVKNVSMVAIIPDNNGMTQEDWEDFGTKSGMIQERMLAGNYVEAVHQGYFSVPLNRPASYNFQDSLTYNRQKYKFYIKTSDDKFPVVFKPLMITGTWFKDEAFTDGVFPAVVTKTLVEKLGVNEPVGMLLSYQGRNFRVTGVMPDFKTRTYDESTPTAVFAASAFKDTRFESNAEMAILIKDGQMRNFINAFWKEALAAFPGKAYQPFAADMEELNKDSNIETYLILLITVIPTLFLIIFAFLGTFSLMYRQSKRSTGEYGLRMALGSTRNNLRKFVFIQSCLLTSIAAAIGCFISVNLYLIVFPEVAVTTFIIAVMATIILMFLFAIASVWYPAYAASKTQPAIALKQEE